MRVEKTGWSREGVMRRFETGPERCFGERERNMGGFEEEQTEKKGGRRERKRRGVQPSRTCLVLFHQPSPWKLASSSLAPSFPLSLSSSLSFAWNEVIRESERGRDRARGCEREEEAQSPTLSCQRRSEETSSPICSAFQLPFRSLAHSLLLCFLVDKTLYILGACVCVCMWLY